MKSGACLIDFLPMPRRPLREGGLFDEPDRPTPVDTDTGERAIATEINPDVLRWARETAGVEVQSLVRRFPKLDAWERGSAKPTVSQLETLSDIYKRPLATFFLSSPPKEPPAPRDFRLLARDQGRTLSKKTRLAMRAARRAQRIYATLLREMHGDAPRLPRIRVNAHPDEQGASDSPSTRGHRRSTTVLEGRVRGMAILACRPRGARRLGLSATDARHGGARLFSQWRGRPYYRGQFLRRAPRSSLYAVS